MLRLVVTVVLFTLTRAYPITTAKSQTAFEVGHVPPPIRVVHFDLDGLEAPTGCSCRFGEPRPHRPAPVSERLVNSADSDVCHLPSRFRVKVVPERARQSGLDDEEAFPKDGTATTPLPTPMPDQQLALHRREVARLLGGVSSVRPVPVEASSFACVDGRQFDSTAPRTPGGDFAEFVYFLTYFENKIDKLTQGHVDSLLSHWIDVPLGKGRREHFYFHTDLDAIIRIQRSLGIRGPPIDIAQPNELIQNDLLAALVRPENQGSIHVRLLMEHADNMGVNAEVSKMLIRSFFTLLWNGDRPSHASPYPLHHRLKLVVALGHHKARAWFNVYVTVTCNREGTTAVFGNDHGAEETEPEPSPSERFRSRWRGLSRRKKINATATAFIDASLSPMLSASARVVNGATINDRKESTVLLSVNLPPPAPAEVDADDGSDPLEPLTADPPPPRLRSSPPSPQVFVSHEQAVRHLRWQLANFAKLRRMSHLPSTKMVYLSIMGIARHAIAVTKELLLLADDGSPLAEYAVYVL